MPPKKRGKQWRTLAILMQALQDQEVVIELKNETQILGVVDVADLGMR